MCSLPRFSFLHDKTLADKFYPDPAIRPGRVSAVVHRLRLDASHDVRAFVEHLIMPGDPSPRLLRGPSPPVTYAVFSRPPPPPKTPSLEVVTALKDLRLENHRERQPPESKGEGELGSHSTLDPRPELDECQPC